jgi:hypothetical protein
MKSLAMNGADYRQFQFLKDFWSIIGARARTSSPIRACRVGVSIGSDTLEFRRLRLLLFRRCAEIHPP